MVALKCPMCCKRKFKTHLSLKYHILSYMHNIFCTVCLRRVCDLQELVDHLEAGCDKAYQASFSRCGQLPPTETHSQKKIFASKAVQVDSYLWDGDGQDVEGSHNTGQVSIREAYTPSSTGFALSGQERQETAAPAENAGECTWHHQFNSSLQRNTSRRPSSRSFACNMCGTVFTNIEEHIKCYHSKQDVEVHRRDLSVIYFWGSEGNLEDRSLTRSQLLQKYVCSREHRASLSKGITGSTEFSAGVVGWEVYTDDSRGEIPNHDSSSNTVQCQGTAPSSVDENAHQSVGCEYHNSKKTSYTNNRYTEHAYSSLGGKSKRCFAQVSPVALEQPVSSVSGDEEQKTDVFDKDKLLCVCNNHQHKHQHTAKKESTATMELSEAVQKLFSHKNSQEIPTVAVFNGSKLTSILTPKTSTINMKLIKKCTSLLELAKAIESRTKKARVKTVVKSIGESVYKDSSGTPSRDVSYDFDESNVHDVDELDPCLPGTEISHGQESQQQQVLCERLPEEETNLWNKPAKESILTIHLEESEAEVFSEEAATQASDVAAAAGRLDKKQKMQKKPRKVKAVKKIAQPQTFMCNICSTEFTKKVAFVCHQRMHFPKVAKVECNADGTPVDYTCKECLFVAEHRRGLMQHMRIHFPEEYNQRCAEKKKMKKNSSTVEAGQPMPRAQGQEERKESDDGACDTLELCCTICSTTFSKRIHLDEHVRTHYQNANKDAWEERELVEAVVERANTNTGMAHTFTCEICDKTLDVVFRQMHIQTHIGDERFTCEICSENLYTREQLNLHMRAHRGDNPYICRVCKQKFTSIEELEKHALSHNGHPKRYPCRFCSRWFSRPAPKVEHERVHTGEKPFSCNYCGMKFRLKGTRELHVRIHTGLKPYSCHVCNKRFRSKYNLRSHVASHSDERNFKCSICPKAFKTAITLASHKNYHTKPYKCPVCQRRFDSAYSERQHRLSHSAVKSTLKYKCTVCGSMYARSFGLRDHMLTHEAKVPNTGGGSTLKKETPPPAGHVLHAQTSDATGNSDNECTTAVEFLQSNLKEEPFELPSYIKQDTAESEMLSECLVDDPDEMCDRAPEITAYVADGDMLADGYMVAAVEDEDCKDCVEFMLVEDGSPSQYVLTVTKDQFELQDMYGDAGQCSQVVTLHDGEAVVGLPTAVDVGSADECVPPVPVNFEEV